MLKIKQPLSFLDSKGETRIKSCASYVDNVWPFFEQNGY